jgi:hypothetical protein
MENSKNETKMISLKDIQDQPVKELVIKLVGDNLR